MLYGIGWIIAAGTSVTRFVVITISLLITLVLGYIRFVRGRAMKAAPAAGAAEGLGDIEMRVTALEQRMDRAADAFRSNE
jgi:hypothetical protein